MQLQEFQRRGDPLSEQFGAKTDISLSRCRPLHKVSSSTLRFERYLWQFRRHWGSIVTQTSNFLNLDLVGIYTPARGFPASLLGQRRPM